MNWRALVWRLATWLAGPQSVRLTTNVTTRLSVRDPELSSLPLPDRPLRTYEEIRLAAEAIRDRAYIAARDGRWP